MLGYMIRNDQQRIMMRNGIYRTNRIVIVLTVLAGIIMAFQAMPAPTFSIHHLRVEYTETPLGIDIEVPRFSWLMVAPSGKRGFKQSACQIVVKDPGGTVTWDSGKVMSDVSIGLFYAGEPLQATTRYSWSVTVWDQNGDANTAFSWFETGLMNADPDLSAWDGAAWIGGSPDDLVLYSHYLSVFKIQYTLQLDRISNSNRAGFVLGANDSRLLDKNMNMYGIETGRDEHYVKLELDISAVDGSETGLARFNIYRVGYHPDDDADTPLTGIDIPLTLINNGNKYDAHDLSLHCNTGRFTIYIDGLDEAHRLTRNFVVNPVGSSHDYISFPMVADIGFSVGQGQKVSFSNLKLNHYREPSNTLFEENLTNPVYDGIYAGFLDDPSSGFSVNDGAYVLTGDGDGTFVVAEPSRNAMPMLRTEFSTASGDITSARLYVTARGIYELYINGERVGEDYFNPGLTQYNVTHMYQTYDVTHHVEAGRSNAMGVMLGEGWWSGYITYSGDNWNYFGDHQSLLARLVITYSDGTTEVVTTNDRDWKYYHDGPVRYGSFFQGEVYDATREAAIDGWTTAGYDDSAWTSAVEVPLEGTAYTGSSTGRDGVTTYFNYENMSLIGQIGPTAGVVTTLTARRLDEVRPGVYVYDMGQNMVGVPKIKIPGGRRGDKITLRFAEVTYPDMEEYGTNVGMIMLENIRAALAQDTYILKGGDEVIQPRFTFHGYRYLEITGIDEALPLDAVEGVVISSVTELSSSYSTSNEQVNRLWENIVWSMRGNFLSIPTDCPQRNERMGWSGDISVFSRTATYLADVDQFFRRHMFAMRDIQRQDGRFTDVAPVGGGFGGTLWGSAGITVAWETYLQYGDIVLLEEHYTAMKRYLAYLDTRIDPETGVLNEGPLGDWLSPEGNRNDNSLLWSAYHLYDIEIVAKVAEVLGKPDEAAAFRDQYQNRKEHFNATYVDSETHKTVRSGFRGGRFGPPGRDVREDAGSDAGVLVDTQVSYAVPLALGAFNDENKDYAAEHLVSAVTRENVDDGGVTRPGFSLMTGFIGTAWISQALSGNGYGDIAYRLLQQTSYPSWLYPVEQGATTIWERLNSYTHETGFGGNNSMNSFNHYSFGAVGAWMYNYSLGIQRDADSPGFKHFILQPEPDPTGEMMWAEGNYDSMYGRIHSAWAVDDNILTYETTVPANTTATLFIPAASENAVTEDGNHATASEGVNFLTYEDGKAVFELKSGDYKFAVVQ